MNRRSRSSLFAAWAAIATLLLKAAVPLLAATAAELRGLPVAAVCPLYGVAMPAVAATAVDQHAHPHAHHGNHVNHETLSDAAGPGPADPGAPHSHTIEGHGGDHCALTALAALAAPGLAPVERVSAHAAAVFVDGHPALVVRDAAARWAARLGHGPPAHG